MPKLKIRNSYSGSVAFIPSPLSTVRARPDGEVLSLGEIVAMHMRGQDVSLYQRKGWYTIDSDYDDQLAHEAVDFAAVARMDFNERKSFAIEHKLNLASLQRALIDQQRKIADDDAAIAALKEESEKPKVSRSKKYSKNTDDVNDDE